MTGVYAFHLLMQEIPLMYQLLVSGNQQHSEEQVWVMQLLAAGLRGPLDAQLYRSAHLHSYCVPQSACSAIQVSPSILLIYCSIHTLHAQLCMSGHLYSY